MEPSDLIASLERAVAASPDDLALRTHLAGLLLDAGRAAEAVPHAAEVLRRDPTSATARDLMARALAPSTPAPEPAPEPPPESGFDWDRAAADLGVPPPFVTSDDDGRVRAEAAPGPGRFGVEAAGLTLADVGGMEEVKKRLNAAFLAPLRHEALRTAYRKSLRGGLLLYGPPGCGKTYLARALAGELGARFLTVTIADILDSFIGRSEQNVHEIFETARANAPCVLFLDEVDAIGLKRSKSHQDWMRTTLNQLLVELSGVAEANDGVFVLAATNQPWDVDPALRRPGRLDRTVLVMPPDQPAREAIWRLHLQDRPIGGIDVARLAARSDGLTGADIAHACETAAERALMDSVETGEVRLISQHDLEGALTEIRPSVGPWMETARNVALFANGDGSWDELAAQLRTRRRR
ncbi:AAA family ATPase [Nocardioides sp.]|uniref:ATP-binding protein n=1 Tax=Nocardioides sp. TaxID=35761 RepID=UPI0035110738